jgi:nitroreductase
MEIFMEFSELIEKRRAYRSLEIINITEGLIKEIGEAVRLTPSCYNNQPWRFIFVYEKNILEELFSALTAGNIWAKRSSMIVAVLSQKDYDCKMDDGRDYYKLDTGMAMAFLILKAADLGLVAHPIAGYNPELVKKILNIPESLEVLSLIIVGKKSNEIDKELKDYQIEAEKNRPVRKEVDEFIFLNKFKNI